MLIDYFSQFQLILQDMLVFQFVFKIRLENTFCYELWFKMIENDIKILNQKKQILINGNKNRVILFM